MTPGDVTAETVALPLTPAQGRIWADQRLRPESAFYNINRVVEVDGDLDLDRLAHALGLVCSAHDALRFRFGVRDGMPFQRPVRVDGGDLLTLHDVSATEDPAAAARRLLAREQVRPLDLEGAGPLRVLAIRTAAERHILLFQTHHIVSDWWAGGVFFRALSVAYTEGRLERDPAAQFGGYVAQQLADGGSRIRDDTAAVAAYLGRRLGRLELPYSVEPSVGRRTAGSVQATVDEDDRARLAERAAESAASEYMFLLSALVCVLHRWTGSDEFTAGVYVADRGAAATGDMIGLLFEGLPVTVAFDPSTTFAEVLGQVRDGVLTLLSHPTADPERLARDLEGDGSGMASLFDVTFQMYPARSAVPRLGDLRTRGTRLVQETLHDLMAYAHDGPGGLELRLQYDASLFREDAVRAVLAAWRSLVVAAARDPGLVVADTPVDGEGSSTPSRAAGPEPESGGPGLAEALAAAFAAHADRVALVGPDGEEWTYARLYEASASVARRVSAQVTPDAVVPILAPVGPAVVAAWLGVVQGGAAALVIDPEEAGERLRYMLRDSGATLLLCDPDLVAVTHVPLELPRLYLDDAVSAGDEGAHPPEPRPDDAPAALLYTSGSTGRPKGVLVTRAGILNQARHRVDLLRLGAGVRMGVTLPHHFVTFPLQVLSGLLSGSAVSLFPRAVLRDPAALVESGERGGLALLEVSVASLDAFLFAVEQAGEERPLRGVRTVLVAGEKLRPRLARRFAARYPGVELVNAYGMTETTGMVASAVVRDPESFAEGHPTRRCLLEIVDPRGRVVPRGWVGELRVSGPQVALGYWKRPGLSAERFGRVPGGRSVLTGDLARMTDDGEVVILGRVDDQLSLRGLRIEPAEIARVLESHPDVARAEVVLWPVADTDGYLAAYLLSDHEVPPGELRELCLAHLPPAMVPRQFVRVESYPRGRTGKLERHRLPKPDVLRTPAQPPESDVERELAGIWREVLGVEEVSRHSDFFEIGGQSLAAVRVVARIDGRLGVQLAANAVFEHPTLEALARHVEESRGGR